MEDDCWRMDGKKASADGRTPIASKAATSTRAVVVNVLWCLLMVLVCIVIELLFAWRWMRRGGRLVKFGYVQHEHMDCKLSPLRLCDCPEKKKRRGNLPRSPQKFKSQIPGYLVLAYFFSPVNREIAVGSQVGPAPPIFRHLNAKKTVEKNLD